MQCLTDICLCESCNSLRCHPESPALTPVADKTDEWTVDCHWMSHCVNGRAVIIRRGFHTDGASIPRLAWRVIGHPFSKDILPHALAHDALYASEAMTRRECDDWFAESMRISGVSAIKRRAIWSAVRLFGWSVWRSHDTRAVFDARRSVRLIGGEEHDALTRVHDVRFMTQPF